MSESYQDQALRTEAPAPTTVRTETLELLYWLSGHAKQLGEGLDKVKRNIYYGAPLPVGPTSIGRGAVFVVSNSAPALSGLADARLLHAAIGLVTEACELLEAVLDGGSKVNMAEELGDLHWYLALAQSALGVSEARVQAANIHKLRVRYPDKFDSAHALNRSLEEEASAVKKEL